MNPTRFNLQRDDFTLLNSHGEPVIYKTNDASANVLTLAFTNQTGLNITLRGSDGAPAPSTFHFNFQQLLPPDKAGAVIIDPPAGWKYTFAPAKNDDPPSWSLMPIHDCTIKDRGRIEFVIRKIVCVQTK